MPPKNAKGQQKPEKLAWKWAETTEPYQITQDHIKQAYRLNLKRCTHTNNRRNCRGNPLCLLGLGERDWLGERSDDTWHDLEDPDNERRPEGLFCGLKNLGATCYVNTFLQVWFHNREFRSAIYDYIEPSLDGALLLSSDYEPKSICGHLQLIFALLQESQRRYIDPTSFINCLGLNTTQQQDAQEFSKLFMSVLEDTLGSQPIGRVRSIVQDQFLGEYVYVTRCTNCESVSERKSSFYELDLNIKGHKDLHQCLGEFLQEENLDGDNQYMCSYCNSMQNAVRKIELRRLPPVLNIQLLRFVFDRVTGQKKKLTSSIQFPEQISLAPYLQNIDPNTECTYELSAVLIHRGLTAYSGHYIAHIKDWSMNSWFMFNDEEIEKMKGTNLQLGNEDELQLQVTDPQASPQLTKKPRVPRGSHCSKNAYMLVYRRRTVEPAANTPEPVVPPYLQAYVYRDNNKFENWCKEIISMREENVATGRAKQDEVRTLYSMLEFSEGEHYEWLGYNWLTQWLSENDKLTKIDNLEYLCPHNFINPDKIGKLKCINKDAAEVIYEKFHGGPRLTSSMMCWQCVQETCRVIRLKSRLAEDNAYITAALKIPIASYDTGYWVGKSSLRNWKKLATKQLASLERRPSEGDADITEPKASTSQSYSGDELSIPSTSYGGDDLSKPSYQSYSNDTDQTQSCGDVQQSTTSQPVTPTKDTEDDKDNDVAFNEDIICSDHKRLSTDYSCRRLVSEEIWNRLKSYFPTAPEFEIDARVCDHCYHADMEEAKTRDHYKQAATQMKQFLGDLYYDKGRPQLDTMQGQIYVVTRQFLESWRRFLRNPLKAEPALSIVNNVLLCSHERLIVDPMVRDETIEEQRLAFIHPGEWEVLRNYVTADTPISLLPISDPDTQLLTLITEPVMCEECIAAREEQLSHIEYSNERIWIQKVGPNIPSSDPSTQTNSNNGSDYDDPEFVQQQPNKKKKIVHGTSTTTMTSLQSASDSIRRSSRHRKVRGEKEIRVSSNQTLRDLKVEILKQFNVAPFDQHLSYGSRSLTDDTMTLASLGIVPDAVLKLKVDEPCESAFLMDDVLTAACPEEGFKGTNLHGR